MSTSPLLATRGWKIRLYTGRFWSLAHPFVFGRVRPSTRTDSTAQRRLRKRSWKPLWTSRLRCPVAASAAPRAAADCCSRAVILEVYLAERVGFVPEIYSAINDFRPDPKPLIHQIHSKSEYRVQNTYSATRGVQVALAIRDAEYLLHSRKLVLGPVQVPRLLHKSSQIELAIVRSVFVEQFFHAARD